MRSDSLSESRSSGKFELGVRSRLTVRVEREGVRSRVLAREEGTGVFPRLRGLLGVPSRLRGMLSGAEGVFSRLEVRAEPVNDRG